MDDFESLIKIRKQRLIWIDENVGPTHPDIITYSEEVSELEQEVKNLEIKLKDYKDSLNNQTDYYRPRTNEQFEFHNRLKHLSIVMNDPQFRYRGAYQQPLRYDPLQNQIEDLIELSKLFGLENAAVAMRNILLVRGQIHKQDSYTDNRWNRHDIKMVDYLDRLSIHDSKYSQGTDSVSTMVNSLKNLKYP